MTKEELIEKAEVVGAWLVERINHLPIERGGILFCHDGGEGMNYLLVKGGRGSWGIPFGQKKRGDEDVYAAALRVSQEVLGDWPGRYEVVDQLKWSMVLVDWNVYVVELETLEDEGAFPEAGREGFLAKYDQAMWVGLDGLPKHTQWMVQWLMMKAKRRSSRSESSVTEAVEEVEQG